MSRVPVSKKLQLWASDTSVWHRGLFIVLVSVKKARQRLHHLRLLKELKIFCSCCCTTESVLTGSISGCFGNGPERDQVIRRQLSPTRPSEQVAQTSIRPTTDTMLRSGRCSCCLSHIHPTHWSPYTAYVSMNQLYWSLLIRLTLLIHFLD